MPVDLLMNRSIGPSLLGSLLLGIGFLSLDTFVPLYVQGVRGGGAGAAAWVVTPVMLTWAMSGIIAAPLVVRWGFRNVSMLGSVLIVLGFSGLLVCTALRRVETGAGGGAGPDRAGIRAGFDEFFVVGSERRKLCNGAALSPAAFNFFARSADRWESESWAQCLIF